MHLKCTLTSKFTLKNGVSLFFVYIILLFTLRFINYKEKPRSPSILPSVPLTLCFHVWTCNLISFSNLFHRDVVFVFILGLAYESCWHTCRMSFYSLLSSRCRKFAPVLKSCFVFIRYLVSLSLLRLIKQHYFSNLCSNL